MLFLFLFFYRRIGGFLKKELNTKIEQTVTLTGYFPGEPGYEEKIKCRGVIKFVSKDRRKIKVLAENAEALLTFKLVGCKRIDRESNSAEEVDIYIVQNLGVPFLMIKFI